MVSSSCCCNPNDIFTSDILRMLDYEATGIEILTLPNNYVSIRLVDDSCAVPDAETLIEPSKILAPRYKQFRMPLIM